MLRTPSQQRLSAYQSTVGEGILLLYGKADIANRTHRYALSKLSGCLCQPIFRLGACWTKGGRASVSALLAEMTEKNRKALELELGKTAC